MTFGPPQPPQDPAAPPTERSTGLRLPVARPIVTYVLLVVLVLVFVADYYLLTDSLGRRIVYAYGAQANEYVAAGQYWRLLTSVFLHAGITHLAFNGYALFVLGRDIEGIYGSLWFTVLYFLSGLAGSVAWYVLGDPVPSLGASGAIFGLFGAEAAFFLRNREMFGQLGRQRLRSIVMLLVINLVIGFAIPNINYIAHLGGLAAGFLVGLGLAPTYALGWSQEAFEPTPRLVDTRTTLQRITFALLAVVILLGLVLVGNQRWAG